jgi:hypothetical protein
MLRGQLTCLFVNPARYHLSASAARAETTSTMITGRLGLPRPAALTVVRQKSGELLSKIILECDA